MKATQSCPTLSSPWNSRGQSTRVGGLSFLQGFFPTQGSNPGLPHCRQILYQLSHKRSLRILEWVAYPFSRGSSQPRNRTVVYCIAGRFFTTELSGKTYTLANPNYPALSVTFHRNHTKGSCLHLFLLPLDP